MKLFFDIVVQEGRQLAMQKSSAHNVWCLALFNKTAEVMEDIFIQT